MVFILENWELIMAALSAIVTIGAAFTAIIKGVASSDKLKVVTATLKEIESAVLQKAVDHNIEVDKKQQEFMATVLELLKTNFDVIAKNQDTELKTLDDIYDAAKIEVDSDDKLE